MQLRIPQHPPQPHILHPIRITAKDKAYKMCEFPKTRTLGTPSTHSNSSATQTQTTQSHTFHALSTLLQTTVPQTIGQTAGYRQALLTVLALFRLQAQCFTAGLEVVYGSFCAMISSMWMLGGEVQVCLCECPRGVGKGRCLLWAWEMN